MAHTMIEDCEDVETVSQRWRPGAECQRLFVHEVEYRRLKAAGCLSSAKEGVVLLFAVVEGAGSGIGSLRGLRIGDCGLMGEIVWVTTLFMGEKKSVR